MKSMRKHIIPLAFFHLITAFLQYAHITYLCFRVAGNVDDAFRLDLQKGLQKLRGRAASWRVHDDNVGFATFGVAD